MTLPKSYSGPNSLNIRLVLALEDFWDSSPVHCAVPIQVSLALTWSATSIPSLGQITHNVVLSSYSRVAMTKCI